MTQYRFQLEYTESQDDAIVEPNFYRIKKTCMKYVSLDGDRLKLIASGGGTPYVDFVLDTDTGALTANGSGIGFNADMNLRINLPSQFDGWTVTDNQLALYFRDDYMGYSYTCFEVSDYLQVSGVKTTWFKMIGDQIPNSPK